MTNEKINFDAVEETQIEEVEMNPDDFSGGIYLKIPNVGEEIQFEVAKVVLNKKTDFINKTTGKKFQVGLKNKDGDVKRYDIHTLDGAIFTIPNWEIFFKLLSADGLLMKHSKEHKTFKGAKIKIKRLLNGGHVNMKPEELAKILDKTEEEAKAYQEEIRKAIKENRLYEVTNGN